MLAPHELKNKPFSKSVRGYNPAEVDEYIELLIEKYTELYRENNELERKLKSVGSKLDQMRDEEESIRSTLLNAQKMAEKIVTDANTRADAITASIKERCDGIIAKFRAELSEEKDEMWEIRTRILDFKKSLFDAYREHIKSLQELSVNEIEDIVLPDEDKIVSDIISDVKDAVMIETQTMQFEEIKYEPVVEMDQLKETALEDANDAPAEEIDFIEQLEGSTFAATKSAEGISGFP
ncbi:MAG: DivIVA domain-containing protein [Clostridia bacterium]|nr:DivIVA domain-containing protein [Clostridia bacterium]